MTKYLTEKGSVYSNNNNLWVHERNGEKRKIDEAYYVAKDVLEDALPKYKLKKGDVINPKKKEKLAADLSDGVGVSDEYRIVFFVKQNGNFKFGFSSLVKKVEEQK